MFLLVFSIFSFFLFVSFSNWFSLFLLPFSRFLFVCVSLFPPLVLSWSLSTVSLSYFLTFLILLGSLSSSLDFFSFPLLLFLPSPISSSFSFPLWVILLSPLLPLSRLLSRFSVPFLLGLSFRCFLFVLSHYFSLPRSSPFLSLSLLLPFLLPLLPFSLSSLLFAVFLFEVFLFPPFSPDSLLFPFSLSLLLLFRRLLPLGPVLDLLCIFVPLFIYLASSFSASLLRPLSLPSSLFLLLLPVFLLVLLLFLSPVSFSFCFLL